MDSRCFCPLRRSSRVTRVGAPSDSRYGTSAPSPARKYGGLRFSAVTLALRPRTALTAVNITPGVARRGFAPAYEPLGAKATHCHTRYGQCHPRLANDSSWGARFASIHRARMCRRVVPTVNGVPPPRHCTFLISGQLAYHNVLICLCSCQFGGVWLYTLVKFTFSHSLTNTLI